ncbi:hypothetical protein FH972_026096 [Carpinus fangiana]|uniref:DNA damage-binding protein 1 n=1 Tax=Carpinus fangiana TaxID=176857 RepID=A0A5N6L3F6_9ROSI|nr:hypothetical protein FH972_026096 [Carpinus fangiana]
MAYLAPIHQPSSIRHAVKLNFLSPTEKSLIVAKANRLEIYAQTPDGLSLIHSKTIYGRTTMLHRHRPQSSSTDHLFVGTDQYMYFTLSWNPQTKSLRTEHKYVDTADKSARDAQTAQRCNVDPSGAFMTLEIFEGIVTIIPLNQKQPKKEADLAVGALTEPIPIRVQEMYVRASTFFKSKANEKKPLFAMIHEDSSKVVRLKVRQLTYTSGLHDNGNAELDPVEDAPESQLENGATFLIPVPGPTCGILVLGETCVEYYEHTTQLRKRIPLVEATIFVAWEIIDEQRFILGDEYGRLYLLMLEQNANGNVNGWKLDILGETSRAQCLVYLGNGKVFVGSHQGDSQVITIKPQGLEVDQTLPNIGPILDFAIMDMGSRSSGENQNNEFSSGQARLVTGSGAFKDGSLRSVRSGVGLEDLGLLGEMENITNMFSLRSSPGDVQVDTLVVSFVDETRCFRFSADGDVEELEAPVGVALNEGTLLASNAIGAHILHVTPHGVKLTDAESGMVESEWQAPDGQAITTTTSTEQTLILTVGGSRLVALDLRKNLSVRAERDFGAENQVACVNISFSSEAFCTVGFWQSSTISVLSVDNLQTVHSENAAVEEASVPRSLCLVNILAGQQPTLFIAMADGNVVTYSFDDNSGKLSNKKSIVLGTQQASFRALPRSDGSGLSSVFATCEHPSLIYGSEGRIAYSAVTAEKATVICPFDAVFYPGAIAIASKEDLKIAVVDEERSTHVQAEYVHETVRRIAYSSELKAFGLGTIQRTLEDGVEDLHSHFKLADEMSFNVIATYDLNQDELVESVMRAQLKDAAGNFAERFVVGTAYLDDGVRMDRGRILVLEVTEDNVLKLVAEQSVKGACRCLAMMNDRIVAALVKTVVVYTLDYESGAAPFFTKRGSYRTSTAPIDISVDEAKSVIIVGDLMKSVSVIKYTASTSSRGDQLVEEARHYQTTWATACAQVHRTEDSAAERAPTFLEADAEGNLLVLQQDIEGVTADDRRRLKVVSELCLGTIVNRIRPAWAPSLPDAAVCPRAFLGTVEGGMYLYGAIAHDKVNLLISLQEQMAEYVTGPGLVPFNPFRAYKSQVREALQPVRFVDGELVEQFLDIDSDLQTTICKPLGLPAEDVRNIVEGLRRLR